MGIDIHYSKKYGIPVASFDGNPNVYINFGDGEKKKRVTVAAKDGRDMIRRSVKISLLGVPRPFTTAVGKSRLVKIRKVLKKYDRGGYILAKDFPEIEKDLKEI